MTNDEIAGRLVAAESIMFSILSAVLADWRSTGATVAERVKYLDVVKANVKTSAQIANLNPRASFEALEFADKFLADISEQHGNAETRPGR